MKYTLRKIYRVDPTEDPVRPELTEEFRIQPGRDVFALFDEDGNQSAVICVAYCGWIPTTVLELDKFTNVSGRIAVAYTVWSKAKGAGRLIVNQLLSYVKNQTQIRRVVTLSPLTEMARNFHLKNGASELQVNEETVNYEYKLSKDGFWDQIVKFKDRVFA